MTLPQIIVDLLKLLLDMAVPAAICTMVLAGIALRREGGLNFQAGGSFQRWALWLVAHTTRFSLCGELKASSLFFLHRLDSFPSPHSSQKTA